MPDDTDDTPDRLALDLSCPLRGLAALEAAASLLDACADLAEAIGRQDGNIPPDRRVHGRDYAEALTDIERLRQIIDREAVGQSLTLRVELAFEGPDDE